MVNMKLVIIWVFAIILLAGIGVFGYLNQDLVKTPQTNTNIPSGSTMAYKTCTAKSDAMDSTYRFSIKDDVISSITISYKSKLPETRAYKAAQNISSAILDTGINGLSTAGISGSEDNFLFTISVNPNSYDKDKVEAMTADFSEVSMVIDTINDYNLYYQAISQIGNTYECE